MIFNPTPEHLIETRNMMFQFCFIWSLWGGVGLGYRSWLGANFKINFFWGYFLCLASMATWVYVVHEIPSNTVSKDIQILTVLGAYPLAACTYAWLLGKLKRKNFQLNAKHACFSVALFLVFWTIAIPIAVPACLVQMIGLSSAQARKKKHLRWTKQKPYYYPPHLSEADYEAYRVLDDDAFEADWDASRAWEEYWHYYYYYYLPSIDYDDTYYDD